MVEVLWKILGRAVHTTRKVSVDNFCPKKKQGRLFEKAVPDNQDNLGKWKKQSQGVI